MMRPTQTPLLDAREALTGYLDSLFRDIPVATEEAVAPATTTPPVGAPAAISAPAMVHTDPGRCAVIKVGELRLALPLIELFGIRRQTDRLPRLPGQPPWVLGVSLTSGGRVQVVDAAMMLARAATLQEYPELHLVTIAAGRWALACNGIEKTIMLTADAVRWREKREGEPWFAGVVSNELSSLIDVPALVAWLDARAGQPPGAKP
jgi:purine-binding chemotaxis protein CheW